MSISMTASGNFDNKKSWSGLRKHFEHDENIHHKNAYLELDQSKKDRKFNQHLILENYNDWTEKMFGDYVKKHDAKQEKNSRKYKSVKRFLTVDSIGKKRKTNVDLNYVAKFSDEQHWHDYLATLEENIKKKNSNKKLDDDKIHSLAMTAIADGLADWAKTFNDRNPNLQMFESYIHMDEKGAPHSHNRIMPIVAKKDKKPSTSLNTALAKQYNEKRNGKLLLSRFRKQEDTALLNSISKTVKKELDIDTDFELFRKTSQDSTVVVGIQHADYVRNQQTLEAQNIEIKKNQTILDNQDGQIAVANTKLDSIKTKTRHAQKACQEAEEERKTIINTAVQEAKKNAQKAQKDYVERLRRREQRLNDREKQLENKEQFMKNVEKSFWAGFYNQNVEDIDINTAKDVYNDLKRQAPNDEEFINDASSSFKNAVVYTVADLTHLDFDKLNNVIGNKLHEPSQQQKRQKQQDNDLNI